MPRTAPRLSPSDQVFVSRTRAIARFVMALAVMMIAETLVLGASTAAAWGPEDGALLVWTGPGAVMTWIPILVVGLGLVFLVVGAWVPGIKAKQRGSLMIVGVVAAVFGGMALLVVVLGQGPGVDPCIANPALPECVGPTAAWDVLVTTPAAAHDAATEYPAGTYTACASTPTTATTIVYTGTITGYVDNQNKKITHQVTVDDDAATTGATFSAPDCGIFDFSIRLTNGEDRNGDGTIDAQNYFGQILSITRTTMVDGNGSTANNVFYSETDDGFYVGWLTDGTNWVSAYPGLESQGVLTTGPSPVVNIGTHGAGAADAPALWYVMRNYGPFGYTQPATGTSILITGQIGSPGAWTPFTVDIVLTARA